MFFRPIARQLGCRALFFCKGSFVKSKEREAKSDKSKSGKPKQTTAAVIPASKVTAATGTSIKDVIDEQRGRWITFLARQIALDIFRNREVDKT